ncbi:GGDEF domain-containing protein [Aquabacterium sp. J223]|uniref:GGDEF domain-containing protein n=1 Tax=Aquabacterium sp. J223 TaxID=2898431 RepID=UPI0021AE1BCC|nr:GGDEF domain-containing protein [Aquabacterium sp. J223]UUX96414.1 GGDEF domain-containing protein [Aquabacterium sp. J223]
MTAPTTDLPPADDDPRQRHFVTQSLLGLVLYGGYSLTTTIAALAGLLPLSHALLISGLMLGGGALAYAAMRAGLNRHSSSDPSLTMPQCIWGLCCTGLGYGLLGDARGAVLTLLLLILAFGMFSLTPRQSRLLSVIAAITLGLATGLTAWRDPDAPLALEGTHLLFGATAIWGITVLSERMSGLRSHLRQQKAELREALAQIRRLATQDELTGLHNRRHMRELMARACGEGRTMSLALIDIDHFKRINDGHGHAAGDRVLAAFATAARQVLRDGDVVARWGGEEFLVMLPATPVDAAERVLQRLRERVAALSLAGVLDERCLTFSAGLVACGRGETLDAAIERADRLMYEAKRAGRDRLAVDPAAAAA